MITKELEKSVQEIKTSVEEKHNQHFWVLNQYRIFIYNCLKGLSLYSYLLRTSYKEVKHEEKYTLGQIMEFADRTLNRINLISLKRKGAEAVKKHNEVLEENSNFMFNWLELGMMVGNYGDTREKALQEAKELVQSLNKRAIKNIEYKNKLNEE